MIKDFEINDILMIFLKLIKTKIVL